ncbi:hypothetical protein [Mycobacterium interjectum]|uniref:hypothetical protein n=1 Tax=Mycobacterium interjectum TaxID=33895 RepID=UPI00082F9C90|nr:hypothetical protein [Mycobacterium interjectum]MCV7091372.1 hypothetical protein [Mycobacterium interjectum]
MICGIIALYALALLLQWIGVGLVAFDIWSDQRDLRDLLNKEGTADTQREVVTSPKPGVTVTFGGGAGAFVAQQAARSQALSDFVKGRLNKGFEKRWIGVALLIVGSGAGTGASIWSVFPR